MKKVLLFLFLACLFAAADGFGGCPIQLFLEEGLRLNLPPATKTTNREQFWASI